MRALQDLVIGLKSGGEIGTAVGWRLYQARMRRLFVLETAQPLAVRRMVSFCEAVHEGTWAVEGVQAQRVERWQDFDDAWGKGHIPVLVDPEGETLRQLRPDVLIDAILAKRNLGTSKSDASLVIGLGPGFTAGKDVHVVIETNRGHDLGRVITKGQPAPNTGVPGTIGGYALERVLRAPAEGPLVWHCALGDKVEMSQVLGEVAGVPVTAQISGILRGQIRSHGHVPKGIKLGDIDPRGDAAYLHTISDKGRAIAGAVLEAILRNYP